MIFLQNIKQTPRMPVLIVVIGAPKQQQTEKFIAALKQRIYGMKQIYLTEEQVKVVFLGEASIQIFVFVENFFNLHERTPEVREEITQRIAACCFTYLPDAKLCECTIRPFNPFLGFCSISR